MRCGPGSTASNTAFYMNEESISLMKKKGVPFIPTLSALHNILNKGVEAGIPAFAVEKTQRVKTPSLEQRSHGQGCRRDGSRRYGCGNPFNEHGQNVGEMIFLVDQGYSPVDALRAGTSMAAKVLGVEKDFGTVEEAR